MRVMSQLSWCGSGTVRARRELLDEQQQGAVVQRAVALGAQRAHELGDVRAERDGHPGLARGGGHDAEVLVVQVDAEARVEAAGQHALALRSSTVLPARPAAEHRDRGVHVDAVRLQEDQRLGQQLQVAGHDELVGGLDGLAAPDGPTWTTVLPIASSTGRARSTSAAHRPP
jgi:hypothetical protein